MRVARLTALAAAAALVFAPTAAFANYPKDPPNDPSYAPAEQGGPPTCLSTSVNDEQHYLYSFMPMCAPGATDPENASGMSVDKAWANYTTGQPNVVLAYIEAGINWHNGDSQELADKVFLNTGELPLPEDAGGQTHGTYDLDGDGAVTAADYSHDPRVHDSNNNGIIDPEDLIVAFSNGTDDDHNGFVDDISGWDFYDNQNDPATVDATYAHSDDQMKQAAAQTNNGFQGAGVCPRCMILPIKAGAEALDRTDDLAQAWLYAGHMGAKVIVSVTADLGYSTYMSQAVEALWKQGVVMVESSNDFDSTDHQGSMFHPHVLPGNGLVTNTQNIPVPPAANALTTSYRERSDLTSWGTHNMFSVATDGGSTSESTPTVAGVMGLVLSYGEQAAHPSLTGPEAIQVVRATASDIADPSLDWPGKPGWDLQYGYGRPNVYKAMQAIAAGDIPPVAWFEKPDWYSLYDPTQTRFVPISGHVGAPRSSSYHWTLQYALGAEPSAGDFHSIGSGSGSSAFDGTLGTLDLSKIPSSFWNAPFHLSTSKQMETNEKYTVTLRLRVYDAANRMGEERRTIAVHHDATLAAHFPLHFGPSGESQPTLADLQGTGHLALVFGDADGRVHAIDGVSGHELPGWPATTTPVQPHLQYSGINPGHEPIIAPPAIGDLFHNGHLEVVVTSTTGRVYVYDANGRLLPGWPKALNHDVVTPAIPRPAMQYTRLPHLGSSAPPVLYNLDGRLDVIQAGWDGDIYVWHGDGSSAHGWPLQVTLPSGMAPDPGHVFINDAKIDAPPAIADLDGDGKPELVVRSQRSEITGAGIQPDGIELLFAFHHDGTPVSGWPVKLNSLIEYYGSAQEFITEGVEVPAVADVNGDGKDEVAAGPVFSPTYLINGDGSIAGVFGPAGVTNPFTSVLADPAAVLQGNLPPTVAISFTTAGSFGKFGPGLSYLQPGTDGASMAGALLVPGSGVGITSVQRAYDAASRQELPGFPAQLQGLDFLGGTLIADVTGDGQTELVTGADTSALHAFSSDGTQATGWPKFTTGWTVFAPSIGDLTSSGHVDVATVTREGYLMVWHTPGLSSANTEWWTTLHDEWHSDRYGVDARPPGAIRAATWSPGQTTLSFTAPGDNWYTGKAKSYDLVFEPSGSHQTVPAGVVAGGRQDVSVPTGTTSLTVQAVDAAGNLGLPLQLPKPVQQPVARPSVQLPRTGSGPMWPAGLAGAAVALVGGLIVRRRLASTM